MVEYSSSGIWLQILVVGDELDDSVPDFCSNVVASSRNELQDSIDIPLVLYCQSCPNLIEKRELHTDLGSETFRQDCDLENHLFSEIVVCRLQVLDQLPNDDFGV